MAGETGWWIAFLTLFLISGFFRSAEAAFFSMGAGRLLSTAAEGERTAEILHKLLEVPRRLIITFLLATETANLLLVILLAWILTEKWPGSPLRLQLASLLGATAAAPLPVSVLLSFFIILAVAQVIPRTLGAFYNLALFRAVAFPLWIFMQALAPLRRALRFLADLFLGLAGARLETHAEGLAEEDLREIVEAGSRQGVLDLTERELLVNLIQSGEISAGDIMSPRHQMAGVSVEAGEAEARRIMEEHNYSRLPVYDGDPSHVVGVVTAKGLLRLRRLEHEGKPADLRQVMRPPLFVPESRRLRDLLLDFKRERLHMALVVDEFGDIAGVVTMEDVLAEIFGELSEEAEEGLVALGENHWRTLGRLEISDFNRRASASLHLPGGRTLGGLVLSRLGRRPRPGDEVRWGGFIFTVKEVQGIIIRLLEVKKEDRKK